ncbi:MAG: hypothetical protein IT457_23255 [Planctomycetes bacterium]|nr:hypothetical protein [Planctomycetota bacterium]
MTRRQPEEHPTDYVDRVLNARTARALELRIAVWLCDREAVSRRALDSAAREHVASRCPLVVDGTVEAVDELIAALLDRRAP